MALSLLTNLPALNAKRHLADNAITFETAAERLASGKRINKASDDAAGMAISYSLESKIRSMQQASRNARDALSLIQVAEGGMNEVGNILIRIRELAIQAASDSVGDAERAMLHLEATQLGDEVNRIANSTKYLGTNLLNGTSKDFTFQVGIENDEFNRLHYSSAVVDIRPSTLGIDDLSFETTSDAQDSLSSIDSAILRLHIPRAEVGAIQSRIQATIGHLANYEESLTAANSRIRDADLASEATKYVQAQIQQKAAVAVLSQANQVPVLAYKLIEG